MRKTVSSPGSCRKSQLPLFSQTYPPALQLHHTEHSFTGWWWWWWWWSCVCFAEEEQLSWRAAGPSCPDHSGQHCENAVTTKKSDLPSPHPPSSNPITQNQRQGPLGVLPRCARAPMEPGVQELWPRGLQSRNCALCAAEICTVISSAARVRGLRVARRPGPDRLAADGRADSMALRWASLKLACCCCSFG